MSLWEKESYNRATSVGEIQGKEKVWGINEGERERERDKESEHERDLKLMHKAK